MEKTQKDFLTTQEFADCIGVHYNTVRKMIKIGNLNAFKIGGGKTSSYRISRSEIERLSIVNLLEVVDGLVEEKLKTKSLTENKQ